MSPPAREPTHVSREIAAILKRAYDLPIQKTTLGRRKVNALVQLVTDIARTARTLERAGALRAAVLLVRYASEVTDIACEYATASAEIPTP